MNGPRRHPAKHPPAFRRERGVSIRLLAPVGMSVLILGILLLLVPCRLAAQGAVPAPALEAVPHPDLEPLEAAVAEQLAEVRELAVATLQDAGATATARAEAFGELGRHYHAYGLAEAAETCYANAAALAPEEARWPYLRAALLQGAGRFEEAAAGFRRVLELDADNLPAWIHLGEVELDLSHPAEARVAAERALTLAPSEPAAEALLGQVALSEKRWEDAARSLETALERIPEASRLHYPLGLAYRGLGQMDLARRHLAQAGSVGVRPSDPWLEELETLKTGERVYLLRGRRAFQAGDYGAAVEAFRRAVTSRPDSPRAHVNLGSALGQTGERQAAIEQFRAALDLEPDNTVAHFNLAVMLLQEDALEEALPHLERTVAAEPDDFEARLQLARTLSRLGRTPDALPHFRAAVRLEPGREEPRLEEAQGWMDAGDPAEALRLLEEAWVQMPASGWISHALARLLASSPKLEQRDGARALDLAQRVFEARPTVLHAETVALALAESGRCADAATWQQRAIEAAQRLERPDLAAGLQNGLARYQAGPPCRPGGGGSSAAAPSAPEQPSPEPR